MKKKIIAVLLFIAALIPGVVKAQTLHVLIACCTEDPTIGRGMQSNKEHMTQLIQNVIGVTDCLSDVTTFEHGDVTKANVTEWIRNLIIEPDDVVMFFYGGHGGRALNDSDPFPQMCMNVPSNQALYMPVSHVDSLLKAKHPRLRIIITECCNSEDAGIKKKPLYAMSAGDYTSESQFSAKALRDLFFNSKGVVKMSSSKAKEYSWCTANGGIFIDNFIDAFNAATESGKTSASWESIFMKVHDKTWQTDIRDREGRIWHQEPIGHISAEVKSDKVIDKDDHKDTSTLFKSLQTLLDKSVDVDTRLSRIAAVKSSHFTSNAQILTVGADMSTVVDLEDVDTFLRRIVLSGNIKQVNVLKGMDTGKNSSIKVHELRN